MSVSNLLSLKMAKNLSPAIYPSKVKKKNSSNKGEIGYSCSAFIVWWVAFTSVCLKWKVKYRRLVFFLFLIHCSFHLTVEDLVVKYYDKNISTFFLLERLNMNYSRFDMGKINCRLLKYSCERICPLDDEDTERMDEKMCYCDRLCVELGDCCFDYFLR